MLVYSLSVFHLLFPLLVVIYQLFIGCTIATIVFLFMNYEHNNITYLLWYQNPRVMWCVPSIYRMYFNINYCYFILCIYIVLS